MEDSVRGCLLGGAVGDALGEPIEFMDLDAIRGKFGPDGVTGFDGQPGLPGLVSDDTQMTMWTVEALTSALDDPGADLVEHGHTSYLRWLLTQGITPNPDSGYDPEALKTGRLFGVPQLWHRRAPGNTCLSALRVLTRNTVVAPNDSKGCGGVMRVATVGFLPAGSPLLERSGRWNGHFGVGALMAAWAHGHPSGYLAAGALAHLIHLLAGGMDLTAAVDETLDRLSAEEGSSEVVEAVEYAVAMAANVPPTPDAVQRIGQGWVAEEALAIAVYCSLVAEDFRHGVLLGVNHSGDSDSTGSITGQILGTIHGVAGIPSQWLRGVEMGSELTELADRYVETIDRSRPEAVR